jgi:hypothetical protein
MRLKKRLATADHLRPEDIGCWVKVRGQRRLSGTKGILHKVEWPNGEGPYKSVDLTIGTQVRRVPGYRLITVWRGEAR